METFNVLIYPWRMLNFLIKLLTLPNSIHPPAAQEAVGLEQLFVVLAATSARSSLYVWIQEENVMFERDFLVGDPPKVAELFLSSSSSTAGKRT